MGRINEQWMAARREAGGSLLFFQSALFVGASMCHRTTWRYGAREVEGCQSRSR